MNTCNDAGLHHVTHCMPKQCRVIMQPNFHGSRINSVTGSFQRNLNLEKWHLEKSFTLALWPICEETY